MRSQIRRVRQPLSAEELASAARVASRSGVYLDAALQASLKDVPLEERRNEAKKPLYLVRYE